MQNNLRSCRRHRGQCVGKKAGSDVDLKPIPIAEVFITCMIYIGAGNSASTTVELDGQVDIVSLESEVSVSPLGGTNGDPKEWFGRIAAHTYVTGADRVRITHRTDSFTLYMPRQTSSSLLGSERVS